MKLSLRKKVVTGLGSSWDGGREVPRCRACSGNAKPPLWPEFRVCMCGAVGGGWRGRPRWVKKVRGVPRGLADRGSPALPLAFDPSLDGVGSLISDCGIGVQGRG